jgi:hypothetical protein
MIMSTILISLSGIATSLIVPAKVYILNKTEVEKLVK